MSFSVSSAGVLDAKANPLNSQILILSDSRLGNLGWHTDFTADGAPVDNKTFRYFGQVCANLGGPGSLRSWK